MFTTPAHLLALWKKETAATRSVLAAMPQAGLDYRPHPKSRSARELAWHLATASRWFTVDMLQLPVKGATREEWSKPPEAASEFAEAYGRLTGKIGAAIAQVDSAWLARETDFFGTKMTNAAILGHMFLHDAHHRGQLTAYLRPMGGKVPAIYGDSADTKK